MSTIHFTFSDLTTKEDELFRGFSESRRRGLRRWEESGVSIVTNRDALTLFFLNHYREFFRQKGFPLAYDFDESTVAFLLALNQIYMIGAATASGLQSVLVCSYTQDVADALFSVSLPEGRHHGVGLHWHAARHFQHLGVPCSTWAAELAPTTASRDLNAALGLANCHCVHSAK